MERVTGNDPVSERWQRAVIPLYDTRRNFGEYGRFAWSKPSTLPVFFILDNPFRLATGRSIEAIVLL